MKKPKKINILSLAKFQALMLLPVGLLCGILYSVGGLFYDLATIGLNAGTALAFLALLGMPLIFAFTGFVAGIVEAILYNLFAKWYKGIRIDFD